MQSKLQCEIWTEFTIWDTQELMEVLYEIDL